jgi:hypothetical protein
VAAHHFFASPQQPAGFLCKQVVPGQHRREAPFFAPVAQLSERSPPKAEVAGEIPTGSTSFRASGSEGIADPTDRESVSLGGASPLSPTIFMELKPQQTGTRLLIGYGEVATTSGSTNFLPGRLISRTSPFEGERGGASPSPAASFRSVVKQDHIRPTPRNRRGSTFPSDHFAAECGSLHTCL